MNAQKLLSYLEPLISSCSLWAEKKIRVVIIANPNAGGFTQKRLASAHEAALVVACAEAQKKECVCAAFSGTVFCTEYAGHAAKLARAAAEEALANPQSDYVIVCAGGDGTGLEIQTEFARLVFENTENSAAYERTIKDRITVLRLPFGTGNDGSDGRTMRETLERLVFPSHFALQRAVRVYYEEKNKQSNFCESSSQQPVHSQKNVHYDSLSSNPPWYAFNIASIGIDAFIAHMTNHTKGLLPGNFYKLWIDLACLFYGTRFSSGQAKITAYDAQGAVVKIINTDIMFSLMGSSGHRTYGSNQKILPDSKNVCIAKQLNIVQKLLIKEQFKAGKHSGNKAAILFDAAKLVIEYNRDILAQLDGEIHYIGKNQFPLVFELTEPVIRIIELDSAPFYWGTKIV